ncbi:armadillo-type protein [Lipomyces oligophaga]|uniref:armadillo-type protein n=1 Tax=Lipomyces oligophaga TaxID=45792 RepID=UPI0034D00598
MDEFLDGLDLSDPDQVDQVLLKVAELAANEIGRDKVGKVDGLLQTIINLLSDPEIGKNIKFQCLRVLGNTVADNDYNRNLLLRAHGFEHAMKSCLDDQDTQIRSTGVIVMFNLCNEFEPAQVVLVSEGFVEILFRILRTDTNNIALTYSRRVLNLIFTNESVVDEDLANVAQITGMLETISDSNVVEYVELLANLFSIPSVIKLAVVNDARPLTLICKAFDLLCDQINDIRIISSISDSHINNSQKRDSEISEFQVNDQISDQIQNDLVQRMMAVFTQISETSQFEDIQHNQSLTTKWRSWINTSQAPLVNAGLLLLGNLCVTESSSTNMIAQGIHEDLMRIVHSSQSEAELYSAGGFLKNLAISEVNKRLLSDKAIEAGQILIQNNSSEIILTGLGLLRVLTTNYDGNAELLIEQYPDILNQAIELYSQKTDILIKVEIIRLYNALIKSLCLTIKTEQLINMFKETNILSKSLLDISIDLATEFGNFTDTVVLLSESILSLALLSRNEEARVMTRAQLHRKNKSVSMLTQILDFGDDRLRHNICTLVILVGKDADLNSELALLYNRCISNI